jgi:Undecaprenyl-phosphate glucose phosphotransferase
MIRSRLSYVRFHLRVLTLLLPACAYFIAVKLRFGFNLFLYRTAPAGLPSYWSVVLLTTIAWAIAAEEFGLSSIEHLYSPGRKSRRLFEAIAFTYVIVMALGFLYRQASYSRVVAGISALALFILATVLRVAFRVFLEFLRRSGRSEIRILMVGADAYAGRIAASLIHGEVLPCNVVGFVRLPGQEVAVGGTVYEADQIPVFSNGHSIDDVIIALPASRMSDVQQITPALEKLCVPTRLVFDLGEGVGVSGRFTDLGGIPMLDLQPSLAETGPYLFPKRIFDIGFSILVLLLTCPLMLLIALAIKLESPGPILFSQDRVGLNGRVFRMLKFRTMKALTPGQPEWGWTTPDDPRRTHIGSILRQFNLDELPQFFNVLWGDMSIVGPRPEMPHYVERHLERVEQYNSRHFFRVGITGWAQVNGWRGDTSIAKRIEYDLYYLRNWSLTFDLQIMTMTIFRIFNSKNAY